jgi:hypothetical protein
MAEAHVAWVRELHARNQKEKPDERFKGLQYGPVDNFGVRYYAGSFSSKTLDTIRKHPDVRENSCLHHLKA